MISAIRNQYHEGDIDSIEVKEFARSTLQLRDLTIRNSECNIAVSSADHEGNQSGVSSNSAELDYMIHPQLRNILLTSPAALQEVRNSFSQISRQNSQLSSDAFSFPPSFTVRLSNSGHVLKKHRKSNECSISGKEYSRPSESILDESSAIRNVNVNKSKNGSFRKPIVKHRPEETFFQNLPRASSACDGEYDSTEFSTFSESYDTKI